MDNPKTILITGASSGIGQATALRFAKDNNLIITYSQNQAGAEQTAQKCLDSGARDALVLPLDLSQIESIQSAVNQISAKYNQIDILINNAGTIVHGNLSEIDIKDISSQIRINLEGLIILTKLLLPKIQQSIINIGSNLGIQAKGTLSVYSAVKFGVRGFSQALAQENPSLKVYTVNPGLTATKMGSSKGMDPANVAEIIFSAAQGEYKAKSGSDVNVRDYQYGEFLGKIVKFLRYIKKMVK